MVLDVAVYGDKLIVGGAFTSAGGYGANNIAMYTPQQGATKCPLRQDSETRPRCKSPVDFS